MRVSAVLVALAGCSPVGDVVSQSAAPVEAMPATHLALVGVADIAAVDGLKQRVTDLGGDLTGCFELARVCYARFPDALPLDALRAAPGVRYAEADALIPGVDAPRGGAPRVWTTPGPSADCADPWELAAIDVAGGWNLADGRGAVAPVVSVMDSGFLTSHHDLQAAIWGQYDYGNSDPDPEVETAAGVPAHGTFISGVIAGADNGEGGTGVLPSGRLNLQKIADDNGALFYSYAIRAMEDAAEGDLGIRVVNYSIAGPSYIAAFQDAVLALGDAGILLVTAAGNCSSANCGTADNDATPMYPASFAYDHIVSVAGHLQTGELNPYSHYGATSVDLAAPGVDLCAPGVLGDDDYYTSGGTSYATPLVAGVAALTLGAWPRLTPGELARVLRASAVDEPGLAGLVRSGGRLSASAAQQVAVPRLDLPADRVIDRYGTLTLELDDAGAEGRGYVVLTHPDALEVVRARPPGWSATTYAPGEVVDLPDAAGHVAVQAVTVLEGPLDADAALQLVVEVRGHATGSLPVTARLIATSAGTAAWLNAPYADGAADETGLLAHSFRADVSAAVPAAGLTLTAGPVTPGAALRLEVSGASPGDEVWLARGDGPANGPCPAFSADRCAHLTDVAILGRQVADGAGVAVFSLRVPAVLPPDARIGLQAAVTAAPGAWSDALFLP